MVFDVCVGVFKFYLIEIFLCMEGFVGVLKRLFEVYEFWFMIEK